MLSKEGRGWSKGTWREGSRRGRVEEVGTAVCGGCELKECQREPAEGPGQSSAADTSAMCQAAVCSRGARAAEAQLYPPPPDIPAMRRDSVRVCHSVAFKQWVQSH